MNHKNYHTNANANANFETNSSQQTKVSNENLKAKQYPHLTQKIKFNPSIKRDSKDHNQNQYNTRIEKHNESYKEGHHDPHKTNKKNRIDHPNSNNTDLVKLVNHFKISPAFSFLKKHRFIFLIILLALIYRIVHLQNNFALWWDSSIYLGTAKYLYSFGNSGIFEPFRPLVHPILLGFFHKVGANIVIVGKSLDLVFSLTTIFLTFKITDKIYSKKAAYYAAFILAIEPLFIMYTGLILTEPIALTLTLFASYLFIERKKIQLLPTISTKFKSLIIGILFSLAALTKFPLALVFFALLITRQFIQRQQKTTKLQTIKSIKESIYLLFGFAIPFIPYLISNTIAYSDPLYPFTTGSSIIGTFLWQYDTHFWFYFTDFFSIFQLFLILPIAITLFFINKDFKHESRTYIFLSSILLFSYFWLFVPRKEIRYLVLMYPFWIILISDIIAKIEIRITQTLFNKPKINSEIHKFQTELKSKIPKNYQKYFVSLILILAIFGAQVFPAEHISSTTTNFDIELQSLGEYIRINNLSEPILASSPYIIEHVDNLIYPTADISLARSVYQQKSGDFSYILIRDCDYICQSQDTDCKNSKIQFLNTIENENKLMYQVEYSFKRKPCLLSFYSVN